MQPGEKSTGFWSLITLLSQCFYAAFHKTVLVNWLLFFLIQSLYYKIINNSFKLNLRPLWNLKAVSLLGLHFWHTLKKELDTTKLVPRLFFFFLKGKNTLRLSKKLIKFITVAPVEMVQPRILPPQRGRTYDLCEYFLLRLQLRNFHSEKVNNWFLWTESMIRAVLWLILIDYLMDCWANSRYRLIFYISSV